VLFPQAVDLHRIARLADAGGQLARLPTRREQARNTLGVIFATAMPRTLAAWGSPIRPRPNTAPPAGRDA